MSIYPPSAHLHSCCSRLAQPSCRRRHTGSRQAGNLLFACLAAVAPSSFVPTCRLVPTQVNDMFRCAEEPKAEEPKAACVSVAQACRQRGTLTAIPQPPHAAIRLSTPSLRCCTAVSQPSLPSCLAETPAAHAAFASSFDARLPSQVPHPLPAALLSRRVNAPAVHLLRDPPRCSLWRSDHRDLWEQVVPDRLLRGRLPGK